MLRFFVCQNDIFDCQNTYFFKLGWVGAIYSPNIFALGFLPIINLSFLGKSH